MATIRNRGEYQWQAIVKRKGWPSQTKTFLYRQDAEKWARQIEVEMDRGVFIPRDEAENTTLHAALERYAREVTPLKKGSTRELHRVKAWQALPISKRVLANIRGTDLAKYRDNRRKDGVADATIRLELMLLSALFKRARKDWGMSSLGNPLADMTLPAPSSKRERRLEADEETRLIEALEKTMPSFPVRALVILALETGMRQSELLGMDWRDVDLKRPAIHLDDTKSGDPRDVPLSSVAVKTLSTLPRPLRSTKIFQITQDRLIRGFSAACAKAEISNLKFHDLRHEAASRLAEKLAAHELAKMFGWRTMQMALRYYHPRAEDLARKLG